MKCCKSRNVHSLTSLLRHSKYMQKQYEPYMCVSTSVLQ